jgi:hypothetical protein
MAARTVEWLDRQLRTEAVIWRTEQRAGKNCLDAQAAMRRINALLDERHALTCPADPSAQNRTS